MLKSMVGNPLNRCRMCRNHYAVLIVDLFLTLTPTLMTTEAIQQAVVPAALKSIAAGLAAAVLLTSSPAHAGVKFEKVVSKKVRCTHSFGLSLCPCQREIFVSSDVLTEILCQDGVRPFSAIHWHSGFD